MRFVSGTGIQKIPNSSSKNHINHLWITYNLPTNHLYITIISPGNHFHKNSGQLGSRITYIYLGLVRVPNFGPQVCFWWVCWGSNFRPLEDSTGKQIDKWSPFFLFESAWLDKSSLEVQSTKQIGLSLGWFLWVARIPDPTCHVARFGTWTSCVIERNQLLAGWRDFLASYNGTNNFKPNESELGTIIICVYIQYMYISMHICM